MLHAIFYAWSHHNGEFYQPLHVLGRANNAGGIARIVSLCSLPFVAFWIYWKTDTTAASWVLGVFWLMMALFATVGFGEFPLSHRLDWEGANYVSFALPLLVAAITLRLSPQRTR